MKNKTDNLTNEEAWIVKWQYRLLGDFHSALFDAICRADEKNLAKIGQGFPDEVSGYKKYAFQSGWWKEVQKKIGKDD